MFPTRFFAASYFAPRYFPRPGAVVPPIQTGGGLRQVRREPFIDDEEEIFIMLLTEILLNE